MEDIWLNYAKRLQSISNTGISFTKDKYDKERYEEVSTIAIEMMSIIGHIPIRRIEDLVSNHSKGYVTPKIDVRGAVFRGNRLLLVRENTDGLWALPGGFADVGLSAAENIEKEIEEEAGIKTQACQLYSVRHKSKGKFNQDVRDFYKLYFICEQTDENELSPGIETIDARFFDRNNIPPLSTGRVVEEDLLLAWKFVDNELSATVFD